jgi:hypothetical protein
MVITVRTSKLRGGQVTPVIPNCNGLGIPSTFIVQTFGVETIDTDVIDATTTIKKSSDMQGQKPGDHDDPAFQATTYASASYSSLGLLNTDGELVFGGTEVHISGYNDDEDSL